MKSSLTRQPSGDESYLRVNLFWLGIFLYFFIPFLNFMVIQTVISSVESNIAYGSLSGALVTAQNVISAFGSYAGLGLLACAVAHHGGKARSIVTIALLQHPVTTFFSFLAYLIAGGSNTEAALFMLTVDMLASLAVYAIILVILLGIRRKQLRRSMDPTAITEGKLISASGILRHLLVSVIVYGGVQLASLIINMTDAFLDPSLGPPVNAQEWIYWVTEYLTVLIYAAIGYFLALAIAYLSRHLLRRWSEA